MLVSQDSYLVKIEYHANQFIPVTGRTRRPVITYAMKIKTIRMAICALVARTSNLVEMAKLAFQVGYLRVEIHFTLILAVVAT